jgi:hypothetical protein
MPLYEDRRDAENRVKIERELADSIVFGPLAAFEMIVSRMGGLAEREKRPVTAAFDGWYGVEWEGLVKGLSEWGVKIDVSLEFVDVYSCYLGVDRVKKYREPFTEGDPGFGRVNGEGRIRDLMDRAKTGELAERISSYKKGKSKRPSALVVYGCGSVMDGHPDLYDLIFYLDHTMQPLLWKIWDGKLASFASGGPDPSYGWKDFYYCDFYLLSRQKENVFSRMDYWLEAMSFDDLKVVPKRAYDRVVSAAAAIPIKQIPIFQPGPWGGYRYRDLWDVPGLGCNAWNLRVGPELSVLIDLGLEKPLNLPFMNLMHRADAVVGSVLSEACPGLFPVDVWLEDGYFPEKTAPERTSMPIHNHPGTGYVRRHFGEPFGRYETYYVAEAYEGANIWLGYGEDADLEDWEKKCRESERNGKAIPDWREHLANWTCNEGDLFLIPAGTTHAHGGNMLVLEMDTTPSIPGTEYSFFLYDYLRKTWDEASKSMTGKPLKLHLDRGFDNEKWRREGWVRDHLIPRARVVKWHKDFWMDRYDSCAEMPIEIERFHFRRRAPYSTEDKGFQVVTLTVGKEVTVRSKAEPDREARMKHLQSLIVPASFGDYEFVNAHDERCTVVVLRWKTGRSA